MFDGIFIADVLGVYDVYRGNIDAALASVGANPGQRPVAARAGDGAGDRESRLRNHRVRCRSSTPTHSPAGSRPSTTSPKDGSAGTSSRRISTAAARNIGLSGQSAHDDRYDVADEYIEVLYKLWEGSWEDDAVCATASAAYSPIPAKVHPIGHEGKYFKVPGIHLSEPSPQRTPVLYQAGASTRGRRFAGEHAECVFVAAPSKAVLKKSVAAVRASLAAAGRDPRSVLIFNLQTVIVDETDARAKAKYEDYKQYISVDGALALGSGWMGIDFGRYAPDEPLRHIETNAVQSSVEAFSNADPTKTWTVRELAEWIGIGGLGPLFVGSPQTTADLIEEWVEETDVDGFNLAYAVTHETFSDIVAHLVPELQKRGRYKREYVPGTLREKLVWGRRAAAVNA